jgi:hypothetical protein
MNLIAMSATVVLLLASGIPAGAQGQNLGNVLDKLSGILGGNQRIHGTVVLTTDTTVVVRGDDASPTTEGSERVHGLIDAVSLTGLTLQADDGRKLTVDTGKVNSRLVQALRPGDLVTVVGRMADQPGTFVADSLQPDSLR